ncbi:rRNA N-glycosidase [Hordeum vulgare]|nr:rRNA N-glycosidase [Hordeum vulgare]
MWLHDEHDLRRSTLLSIVLLAHVVRVQRARPKRAGAGVCLMSTPSPSPTPPPPPPMTEEEEAELMRCVMEDSMNTEDERQWEGLETLLALCAAGDAAIQELEMVAVVKGVKRRWCTSYHLSL